jgi:hypothetical protein
MGGVEFFAKEIIHGLTPFLNIPWSLVCVSPHQSLLFFPTLFVYGRSGAW